MTANQIEYAKLLESRRASQANEALTQQRDLRSYQINLRNAEETERANRAREAQLMANLDEQTRHNYATESINMRQVRETERSNRAKEQLQSESNAIATGTLRERIRAARAQEALQAQNLAETERSHRATESLRSSELAEVSRSHRESERLQEQKQMQDYGTAQARIDLDRVAREASYDIDLQRNIETNRSNLAREEETHRSNTTRESETARSNKVNEKIQAAGVVSKAVSGTIGRLSSTLGQAIGQSYSGGGGLGPWTTYIQMY